MSKAAKIRSTKRPRATRTRAATASSDAVAMTTSASRAALPRQVAPIIRDIGRDRIDPHRLAASGNCQTCFDACARLPVSLQPICRHLCGTVCKI